MIYAYLSKIVLGDHSKTTLLNFSAAYLSVLHFLIVMKCKQYRNWMSVMKCRLDRNWLGVNLDENGTLLLVLLGNKLQDRR
jgi:hypothetical protein